MWVLNKQSSAYSKYAIWDTMVVCLADGDGHGNLSLQQVRIVKKTKILTVNLNMACLNEWLRVIICKIMYQYHGNGIVGYLVVRPNNLFCFKKKKKTPRSHEMLFDINGTCRAWWEYRQALGEQGHTVFETKKRFDASSSFKKWPSCKLGRFRKNAR